MKIKVLYHGAYRDITGKREEIRNIEPGDTLKDLIKKLETIYGAEFTKQLIDEKSNIFWSLRGIIVNGKIINPQEDLQVTLNNHDEIIFSPPVGGG